MNYRDKVIWITGASSGIGEGLAIEFAKRGARLVLSGRREEELVRVGKSTALPPLDLLILPFDLSARPSMHGLAAQVINKFGRIDILVNNGGMSQRSEAMSTEEEIERQLFEVNYFSHVALTKAVLPYMLRQKDGHVVVTSSIAGKFGFFLRSSYSAAKHALHGYFESLRLETEAKGIRILIVCPGKIRTAVSLNAIDGKGSMHGMMDESHVNAMSSDECAKQIIKAIGSGREEVLIGGKELLMVKFKRILPALFSWLVRRQKAF